MQRILFTLKKKGLDLGFQRSEFVVGGGHISWRRIRRLHGGKGTKKNIIYFLTSSRVPAPILGGVFNTPEMPPWAVYLTRQKWIMIQSQIQLPASLGPRRSAAPNTVAGLP
jgi:hypothetical protein